MLPLALPRRHHRRLLLPPGLLALAWLLWLGCVAVPQLRGIRPQHVIEINFEPLHPKLDCYSSAPCLLSGLGAAGWFVEFAWPM